MAHIKRLKIAGFCKSKEISVKIKALGTQLHYFAKIICSSCIYNKKYDNMVICIMYDNEEGKIVEEYAVYFAKVNLASNHLYEVLRKERKLEAVLQELHDTLKSDIVYTEQIPVPLTDEEIAQGLKVKFETIEYKLVVGDKKALGIEGAIFRTSKLYFNLLENGNSLVPSAVKHTDAIRFYFDTFNEFVGFNRKQRFGYQQFVNAFENIINICLEEANKNYRFHVSLYSDGLNLDEIKSELMKISNIERLEIRIQPPNPDEDTLNRIETSLGDKLKELEEAGASARIALIEAKGEKSLKIESKLVEDELKLIEDIHEMVGTQKATSRGYVKIKAENKSGDTFTSDEKRPKTIRCDDENFVDRVRSFVAQIIIASNSEQK